MIVWGLLVTEFWKRKQAHISYTWGYNIEEDEVLENKKEVNKEFKGFYRFSWDNNKVEFMSA